MPESTSTSRQSKLQEDTRFRVLRLLQDNPNLSQRELAKALGISLGGVHYCLQALLDKDLIKIHNFQSSTRKLAYAYLLTPAGIVEKATLTGRFLKRKMEEYEQLRLEIESLQQEHIDLAHNGKPQNGNPHP
jgi:EPS-associated MarR family transcriptional regulator